ncbi:MAG: hypothetical protein Q8P69_00635, partial [bacterium]|nr:hypothetical protein [bacterium]
MIKKISVFCGLIVFSIFSLPSDSSAASVWISGQPSCASGPYSVTVNWDVAPDPTWGYFIDVTPDISFGTFWNKQVSGGLRSVQAISGFGASQFGEPTPSGAIQLNPGTTYYARVWSGTHYPNSSPGVSFNVPVCATATPTPAPSQPVVSGLPACSSGAYNATISWSGTPNSSYG